MEFPMQSMARLFVAHSFGVVSVGVDPNVVPGWQHCQHRTALSKMAEGACLLLLFSWQDSSISGISPSFYAVISLSFAYKSFRATGPRQSKASIA